MRTAYVRASTHDFSLCTHQNFRPVRTMYTLKKTAVRKQFLIDEYSDKIPLNLSQNISFSTSFVRLLCQQSKSIDNIKFTDLAFNRPILHSMQYVMYLQ